MSVNRHRPATAGNIVITPEEAGWMFVGLQVLTLAPGEPRLVRTDGSEMFVLPLAGAVTVEITFDRAGSSGRSQGPLEARYDLAGRRSVFERVTDFAYVGRDSVITLTSAEGGQVALPSALCEQRLPPAYGPAEAVPVESRGSGPATRQVTNFGAPGVWDHAEKLVACELITPPGNWSSYPPHKHDATDPCPVVNEEIYYFRIAGEDQVTPSPEGFGLHRTYTGPEHEKAGLEAIDDTVVVRDGDVYCVDHGYHGPCVAAPGYPMYYLNVLAGPGDDRSMAFCDDPSHAWVRDAVAAQPLDPRFPITSATGRPDHRSSSV